MNIRSAHFLPDGDHKRGSTCFAFVGPSKVSIRWASSVLTLQFPINHKRTLLCFAHPNLDTARNIAIAQWLAAPPELVTDWLVLIAAEAPLRWDAAVRAILAGEPVQRIGEHYVVSRSAMPATGPWFASGRWCGAVPTEKPELALYQEVPQEDPDPVSAAQMVATCIPSLGTTSLFWTSHAVKLAPPMAACHALYAAIGYEVGKARENLVKTVLEMGPRPKYLFFFGDDMIAPSEGMRMLLDTMHRTGAKAVAGLYYMKSEPPQIPILWRNGHAGPLLPGVDFQLGDAVPVDGTGLDFALFDTEALVEVREKVTGPLFRTACDWIEGRGLRMQTEDAWFFDQWRSVYGPGSILVDTRCRVGHYNEREGVIY